MNPDKLFDYLDGKLSPADRAELEEKLMSDPQLRQQFNIARGIHGAGGSSREVVVPSEDHTAVEKSGRLGRRIAVACAVLVFMNVAIGLAVIFAKNKKTDLSKREAEIRQQLSASLGAAAQNAMPSQTFLAGEEIITAPRAQWDHIADRVMAGANAFGGSAAKGLPEETVMTVVADIPSSRDAEFRLSLSSAAKITPMPAIAPGVKIEQPAPDESERTIVQVRIAEAAR